MKQSNQLRIKWIALFFFCILGVAMFVAIFVLLTSGSGTEVNNYEQCSKADGATMLMSSPEQCVIGDKKFTNPNP